MVANGLKPCIIPPFPRTTSAVVEKDVFGLTFEVAHPHVHKPRVTGGQLEMVLPPHITEEPLACSVANSNVRQGVVPRVSLNRIDEFFPERMPRCGAEDIIAQCASTAVRRPCGIRAQRLQILPAAL